MSLHDLVLVGVVEGILHFSNKAQQVKTVKIILNLTKLILWCFICYECEDEHSNKLVRFVLKLFN